MKRGCAVVALAILAALAPSAHAADANGARIVAEESLGPNHIGLTIETPALAAPTGVQVYLPAGYDEDPARRWPVTYYLHGAQGDEKRFDAWYADLIADFPSIVVTQAGGAVGFYSDWYNGGAGGPPMYETYHVGQLIPLIDSRFRTTGDRAGRALIGESMGGYGVMTYAARHPDLFASAVSLSGAVDNNYAAAVALISAGPVIMGGQPDAIYGPRTSDEIRWHGHNPADLVGNLRDVNLQVRTAEGLVIDPTIESPGEGTATDCTLERGVFDMTTAFHEALLAYNVPHVWKNYGAGCHTVPNFRREFTDSLPGLEAVFANPQPAPATFDYRSIEPSFEIWNWRITTDPERPLEFMRLQDAGRRGVTLTDSGTTTVTTPPFYRCRRAVTVRAGGAKQRLRPDREGRIHFTVELGDSERSHVVFRPKSRRVSCHRAQKTFAGKNGRIFFSTNFSTLGSVTPQGKDFQPAVSTVGEDRSPSVSPDGTRLTFTREGGMRDEANQIMLAPVGGAPTPIGQRGLDPVFVGPSGDRLVFEAGTFLEMGENDLTIANVDGSDVQTIAKLKFNGPLRPAVSPDGKTVIYQGSSSQTSSRLFRVDIDGDHKEALTSKSDGAAFNPSFSPDGREIVFQFGWAPPRKGGGSAQIVTMDLKTGTITTLTSGTKPSSDPVFSPDGRKIAFVREGRGLFVMDRNGKNERRLIAPKRADAQDILRIDWATK